MAAINLFRQFEFNAMTLSRLLADVTAEESLTHVDAAGKNLNWIVGHLITARAKLLTALGNEPRWYGAMMAVYGGQETGNYSDAAAKSPAELRKMFDETQAMLDVTLPSIADKLGDPCDALPHVKEGGTLADRVGAFACHEAYHIGQIGLMRRLLGKPGLF